MPASDTPFPSAVTPSRKPAKTHKEDHPKETYQMNAHTDALARALSGLFVRIEPADFQAKGFHACLVADSCDILPELAALLLDQAYFMGFVTACHTKPAVQVLYQFARYDVNHRIMVRCPVDADQTVPTISHIFQGADWHERETRDFFGITFRNHPNMTPFILDASDKDLTPLLKGEKILKTVDDIFPGEETAND